MTHVRKQPEHEPHLMSDPSVVQIPLTRGHVAIVDAADIDRVTHLKWHAAGVEGHCVAAWRGQSPEGKRTILMHRLLSNAPAGMDVDHINGNPLDNRRANLRIVTHKQNVQNTRIRRHNTSGYKGVAKSGDGWRAYIGHNGRPKHIGCFRTAEEAAVAYDLESFKLYGEFARPNFPRSYHDAIAAEAADRARRIAWLDSDEGRAAYDAYLRSIADGAE